MPLDILPFWDPAHLDEYLTPQPGRQAFVELHNLIAAAEDPGDYGPDDLLRISRQHGVDLRTRFGPERRDIYTRFFRHLMRDGDLRPADRRTLARLAQALWLEPADLQDLHQRAFGRAISNAIADDCLDVEERLLLYTLQHTLGLDPEAAAAAYERAARERLLRAIARVLCDGKLSDVEHEEIAQLQKDLDVAIPPKVMAMLRQAAERWHVEHGDLPRKDVALPTRPFDGEVIHLAVPDVRWRTVQGHLRPRVPTSLFWEDGGERDYVRRLTAKLRTSRSRKRVGTAFVTSRRLLLQAQDTLGRVDLRHVRSVRRHDDVVVLEREGSIHWILLVPKADARVAEAVLNRVAQAL